MKRYSIVALVVGLLLSIAAVGSAKPPGQERFINTHGNGWVNDVVTFPVGAPTSASFDFNTDNRGEHLQLSLSWDAFDGGYHCDYFGEMDTGLHPELSYIDSGEYIEITVDGSALPAGYVDLECGDGLTFAQLVVRYSPGERVESWRTNRTGSKCSGFDVINDHAEASALVITEDQGEMVNNRNGPGSANYMRSDWECQQSGTPGKPDKPDNPNKGGPS